MFIKEGKFRVSFSKYSNRYYRKKFHRKYHKQWNVTETAILESLKRVYKLQGTKRLDELCCDSKNNRYGAYKFDFSVAGTKTSPKSSGNRLFLFLDNKAFEIEIMIIFHHEDICKKNETNELKRILKEEFPDYWNNIFG